MDRVSVIGAGVMGHGIAQLYAMAGFRVGLYDVDASVLANAVQRMEASLRDMADVGGLTAEDATAALARVETTTDLREAVAGSCWVTEAIPEVLPLKHDLYAQLEEKVAKSCVIASNTSTLPLAELTARAKHPERFVITHFFNPAQLVPLVEIVRGPQTREDVVQEAVAMLRRLGKAPVVLKKDVPGFIANRLQAALVREAFHLLAEGVADAEDIDRALSEGPGFRWAFIGALATPDFGGLDTWQRVCANLFPVLSNAVEPPAWLAEKVVDGMLGAKTGSGIFSYAPGELEERLRARDAAFLQLLGIKRGNALPPAGNSAR
ncbi:3-hydroxyacyl-CoA dehydrogenase family protein [Alicyclobacillus macrosporangiidus]|uniref:3-hydroxybutyryl-CoA dehydrogenase n=1 Tax=Alicyclobacillus macrosporangiidus TaxID=392015 RepID=A0A1I7JQF8_9BACL|nr:3-hydroxyacyl-CoA dehydrogenase family protein [Alicyclobacillus macrosporangiidus]SFU87429.1 3-hydroxybutyryl-CoA dehydrogenase [Alicyclobacillus macrosporangiidus]